MSKKVDLDKNNERAKGGRSGRILDFVAKLMCLVIAFFIWFYAMSADVVMLERSFTVPVEFKNESILSENKGWSVLDGKGYTIDVTLKGKRTMMRNITENDISAYVDVADVEKAGWHEKSIKVFAPSECEVIHTTSDIISTYIDKKVTTSVPVVCDESGLIIESSLDYELETVSDISVSGPVLEVERIAYAQAKLGLGELTESTEVNASLVLIDVDGQLMESRYITPLKPVKVSVNIRAEKEVPVKVGYKYGYFNEYNVKFDIKPATVKIKGEPNLINGIHEIYTEDIDEKNCLDKQNLKLEIPSGVELEYGETEAEVSLEHLATSTKEITVPSENIIFERTGGFSYELLDETVNVEIRGPITALTKITATNIKLHVNLSNYNETGEINLPATVEIISDDSGVYELGSYKVRVNVIKTTE